jgi:hypothetical protein
VAILGCERDDPYLKAFNAVARYFPRPAEPLVFHVGPLQGGNAVVVVGPEKSAFWVKDGKVYVVNDAARKVAPEAQQAPDNIKYDQAFAHAIRQSFVHATVAMDEAEEPDESRFDELGDTAKDSLKAGKLEEARKQATELLSLSRQHGTNGDYGNATHDANLVLGRIAVLEGRIEDAKKYLLEAGRTPGSPQLDTFGPSMSLAQDLLEKDEREVVLQYFALCRKFWEMENGRLDLWSKQVANGKMPDFGAWRRMSVAPSD